MWLEARSDDGWIPVYKWKAYTLRFVCTEIKKKQKQKNNAYY